MKNLSRNECPIKLNDCTKRVIIKKVQKNPRISAAKIRSELENDLELNVCASTIQKFLCSNGYHCRSARRKPLINSVNRMKRLQYTTSYKNASLDFWNKVIFTDESKFTIFQGNGKKVWRKKNTELEERNLLPSVKHGGGSLMVWGCMSAAGVGSLEFIDGIMDHKAYIKLLKKNLASSAEIKGTGTQQYFLAFNVHCPNLREIYFY